MVGGDEGEAETSKEDRVGLGFAGIGVHGNQGKYHRLVVSLVLVAV